MSSIQTSTGRIKHSFHHSQLQQKYRLLLTRSFHSSVRHCHTPRARWPQVKEPSNNHQTPCMSSKSFLRLRNQSMENVSPFAPFRLEAITENSFGPSNHLLRRNSSGPSSQSSTTESSPTTSSKEDDHVSDILNRFRGNYSMAQAIDDTQNQGPQTQPASQFPSGPSSATTTTAPSVEKEEDEEDEDDPPTIPPPTESMVEYMDKVGNNYNKNDKFDPPIQTTPSSVGSESDDSEPTTTSGPVKKSNDGSGRLILPPSLRPRQQSTTTQIPSAAVTQMNPPHHHVSKHTLNPQSVRLSPAEMTHLDAVRKTGEGTEKPSSLMTSKLKTVKPTTSGPFYLPSTPKLPSHTSQQTLFQRPTLRPQNDYLQTTTPSHQEETVTIREIPEKSSTLTLSSPPSSSGSATTSSSQTKSPKAQISVQPDIVYHEVPHLAPPPLMRLRHRPVPTAPFLTHSPFMHPFQPKPMVPVIAHTRYFTPVATDDSLMTKFTSPQIGQSSDSNKQTAGTEVDTNNPNSIEVEEVPLNKDGTLNTLNFKGEILSEFQPETGYPSPYGFHPMIAGAIPVGPTPLPPLGLHPPPLHPHPVLPAHPPGPVTCCKTYYPAAHHHSLQHHIPHVHPHQNHHHGLNPRNHHEIIYTNPSETDSAASSKSSSDQQIGAKSDTGGSATIVGSGLVDSPPHHQGIPGETYCFHEPLLAHPLHLKHLKFQRILFPFYMKKRLFWSQFG